MSSNKLGKLKTPVKDDIENDTVQLYMVQSDINNIQYSLAEKHTKEITKAS